MADIIAWHGRNFDQHVGIRDDAAKQGYRFLSLSIYGPTSTPLYAAVMIKRPVVVAQRDWPKLTTDQFQQVFDEQAKLGYGPVMIAAAGTFSDPLFAAVFQLQNPIPLTRHRLHSGDVSDLGTIQGMNAKAKSEGLILHWAASYGDAGNPGFAAIWVPNTGHVLWNNDGLLDDVGTYQARFNAEASAWCRPAFVTLDGDNRYMSLFVDNEGGPWVARHNMTPDGYQTEFNTWTGKSFFPVCVQAAGSSASSARFAALFVQTEGTTAKQFHATGPVTNTNIDNVIRQAMLDSPVRHASLAIVHGTKLVYARGYTMAEPDWPVVQPTTCFRIASVSKTVAALAVFQLIESGKLKLSDKLQDILQLKTPSGGSPPDSRFGDITVQHLLEHKSGLNPGAFNSGPAVVQAFVQAGHPANLPVTAAMTDSYIASLGLVSTPGSSQSYNNCGYYLLGRMVAHLRGKSRPIDAYQAALFDPLGIHRIRRAASLISAQPNDEARYQDPKIPVGPSDMTPDRPLVPSEYGTEQLEIMEGSGGLTGALTDIARLIAIMIDQNDNPALKRATITSMLSDGAVLTAAGMGRAGYGFDALVNQGRQFLRSKGWVTGELGQCAAAQRPVGFRAVLGGKATAASSWYPDYPTVMNIARNTAWGSTDLFPQFGMPSM